MVGILTGIIVGAFAGAALGVAGTVGIFKNVNPVKRAADLQRKIVGMNKGYAGRKLNKRLIANLKRQKVALKFHKKPLLEKINFFDYNVNIDIDFQQIWDPTTSDKHNSWRILGIAKTKQKIAELEGKRRKAQGFAREVERLKRRFGIGPMKECGWTESVDKSGGGGYLSQVANFYKIAASGNVSEGADYECLYQMYATCDKKEFGYDPGEIFGKAKIYREKGDELKSENGEFFRFGVDYPTASKLQPDRFVVGKGASKAAFQVSKLVMIANACAKLAEDESLEKIRVIDESMRGKNRALVFKREKESEKDVVIEDYVKDFVKSHKGKIALKALEEMDPKQAQAVRRTIHSFVPSINFGKYESRSK